MAGFGTRPQRSNKRVHYEEPPDLEPEVYAPSTVKKRRVAIRGRSGSAPPAVMDTTGKNVPVYQSGTPVPPFHSYITDISKNQNWNNRSKKAIRLSYRGLDPQKSDEMHGIYIDHPCITGHTGTELPKHLEKIRADMEENVKKTSATEATGEAAAAFAMCQDYAGFTMKWGAHLHSGPGLDQIWHKPTPDDLKHPNGIYMIVEAKGVDATTNTTRFGPPPAIQDQMSMGWIGHNVATMIRNDHTPAIKMAEDVGLTEELKNGGPFYAGYRGASKNYYKCKFTRSKRKAIMKGLVVQAGWTPAGSFSYETTEYDYGEISGSTTGST